MLLMPDNPNEGFDWNQVGEGLLKFVQSPEGMAMAQGLLSQATPSMTEPRSLAGGLSAGLAAMAARRDKEQEHAFERAKIQVQQGKLNVDIANLDLEQQKIIREMQRQQAFERAIGKAESPNIQETPRENAAHEVHPISGNRVVHNPDNTISTENSITVTNPAINGGMPTNISSMINGQQLSDLQAENHAINEIKNGKQYPSFNTIDEAVAAAKARSSQLGTDYQAAQSGGILDLLGQNASSSTPQAGLVNQPSMPAQTQVPTMQPPPSAPMMPPQASQNNMIRLNNGLMVTPAQQQTAQLLAGIGEYKEAAKALTGDLSEPNLVKITKAIYGTTESPEAKQFMHDVELKPQNQNTINLGETEAVAKIKAKSAREDKIIGTAMEGQASGRTVRKLAIESHDLIKKIRAQGFDPFRFDLTRQLGREKIKSALGRGASEALLSDYETLNKNITKMQVESMGDISAKGLNQYFEKQLGASLGSPKEVQALTTQKLMVGAQQDAVEKEFRGAFLQAYQNEYGNIDNAEEAFNTWMDTAPGVKYGTGKNIEFESDRKIASDMKKWVAEPGSEKYIKARLDYLKKKDAKDATDEELEFFREYGE